MKKAALFLTLFLATMTFNLSAQDIIRCHTDERTEVFKITDPAYYKSLQQPLPRMTSQDRQLMDVVVIPVHVIIVHPPGQAIGTGVNFPMDHIQSQIDVLNQDFRRTNTDASNTPPVFAADDSMIEFCLAIVDPDGNPTDGVTRYGTTQNLNSNEFAIKSATGWDRNSYLNIWVGPGLGGLLGWAYLPSTTNLPNATLDGVVTASGTFGGPGYGTTNNYDLGRTTTHEVGHYLGCRHVWGGGGCGNDDGFGDTPMQSGSNFGCPNHPSPSCNNGGDMFMNYMDYVNDDCMNAFTTEQGEYMTLILNTSRSSLLNSASTNCATGGAPLSLELVASTDLLCFGDANGTATVEATGGAGGFTYSIDGGPYGTSNVFTGLTAGLHTITVQDQDGSTIPIDVIINAPAELVPAVDAQIEPSCFGFNDGTIIVSAVGGTLSPGNTYQYNIDGGPFSNNNIFDGLGAGLHTVIVQDENSCETPLDVFITEPIELATLPENITDVACHGDENGVISVISLGGNPMYNYSIDLVNYQTAPIFFDLAAGDYLMTTVDENGCMAETPFTIATPDPLDLAVLTQNDVSCFDETNGSITLEATGGTIGYQYSIDNINFQTQTVFTDLAAGDYTLFVQDENNCISEVQTTLNNPAELVIELTDQTEAGCAGQNEGTFTVTANGGSGGNSFTYGTETQTGDVVTFTNVPAGMHMVTVTDANDCTGELMVQIEESAAIELEVTVVNDASCATETDGLIAVQGGGGNGTYQYNINSGAYSTQNVFSDLSPGEYTIGVLDDSGCEGDLLIEITAPDAIVTEIENQSNPDCSGTETGMIDVNASGGIGNFEYTMAGATNTTGQFNDLAAGNYTVLITDAAGCISLFGFEIEEPEAVVLEETANISPDCFEGNNGSISLSANGGSGVFEYTMDGTTNTTGQFDGLTAGDYMAVVSDEGGCSESLTITIEQPEAINLNEMDNEAVDCFGNSTGSVTLAASGGNTVFEYNLNGETNASGEFTDLAAGTYTATATDENGCAQTLEITVTEPEVLVTSLDYVIDVNCAGDASGAIQVAVNGGSGTLTYTMGGISNNTGLFEGLVEGSYSIDVVDASNCSDNISAMVAASEDLEIAEDDLSPVSCFGATDGFVQLLVSGGNGSFEFTLDSETNSSGLFENLSPGAYSAVVTDGSACSGTYDFEITEPQELAFSLDTQVDITCFGTGDGIVELSANGGSGIYTFDDGTSTNNDGVFNGLQEGIFEFIVTDESGCSQALEATITQPLEIEAEASAVSEVDCNGESNGSFTINATGGAGTLEYTANGETNTTGTFSGLIAGNYPVMVIDANGCERALDIDINEPAAIDLQVTQTNDMNSCFGATEGTIQVAANGGAGDLEFTLGTTTNSTGYFENLAAGDYAIEVVDGNGCSNSIIQSIAEPAEVIVAVESIEQNDCFGNEAGTVQLAASGGSGIFEFTLNGETNTTGYFNNLGAGDFEATIMDGNDCSAIQNINISQPEVLNSEIVNQENIDCNGTGVGSIEVEATGGNGNYEFTLGTNTNTTGIFTDLPAGDYEIGITDLNGCETMQAFNIVEAANLEVEIENIAGVNCFGAETGIIQISAGGGSGTYEFFLDGNMSTTGYFEGLTGGDYEVSVVDQDGCADVMTYTIDQPMAIESETIDAQSVACSGENNGFVQVIAIGGNGVLEYTLNGETNTSGTFENLPAGDYELLVTDEMACTTTSNILIEEPTALSGTILDNIPVSCFGDNTGFIQIGGQGGMGDYTYALGIQSNSSGGFSDLLAGDYEVMITDDNGCTAMTSVTVTQAEAIQSEIVEIQNIDCFDPNGVGTVQVQALGGNGNFQYTLNGSSNGFGYFENLSAGAYEIEITDDNGCTSMQPFMITEGANLEVEIASVQSIACFGATDASIQVSADGGSGIFEFTLGGTTNTTGFFENLAGGDYTIAVMDEEGCESTMEYTVEEPEEIQVATLETLNADCFGMTNGSINVQGQGGNGLFNYALNSENNATGNFENLSAGDYLLVITDNNGCTTSATVTVDQPQPVSAIVMENTAVNCYGADDGMTQVTGLGGNGNFSYTLGTTTNLTGIFEDLPGGIYTLMVADDMGCSGTIELTIEQPEALETAIVDLQSIGCSGNLLGSVEVEALGGTGTIEYTLGSQTNTTGIFEDLNVGDYSINAVDENGCTNLTPVSIIQSDDLEGTIISNTPTTCFGESDGVIQVGVQSGTGTYTYILGTETNDNGMFTDLAAGDYNVEVTDGGGCDAIVSFTIDQPNALLAEAIEISPLTCFGESNAVIQLEAFGGNGPFSFTIGNETNTNGGFENLSAGAYQALVTDQNNCSIGVDIVIIEPEAIQSELLDMVEPICNGDSDGLIDLEAQGGTSPYEYTIGATSNTTGLFDNLSAGNYQVLIEDANGCMSTESVTLTEPEYLISGLLNINSVQCYGGADATIFIGADGGTPGYQFELDGEVNGGGVFFGLAAGEYTVNVTDANNCLSQTVVVVSQPDELLLETTDLQDDTGTGNGSATVMSTGGSAPYVYSLDGINYTAFFTFENLAVGTYTAYVRDSNGCVSEVTFTIDLGTYITNPDQGVTDIQIYPNPFTDDLHLEVALLNAQELELRMFTVHGQELYRYKADFTAGTTNLDLDIPNNLPAGAYIVSLSNDVVHLGHYKLVKQK